MFANRRSTVLRLLVRSLAALAVVGACGGDTRPAATGDTPTEPRQPIVPTKPIIVLATDSVVASAVKGAVGVLTHDVRVTPGDTTRLGVLAVTAGGFGDGDTGAWLSASVDSTRSPASIAIRIDPARATEGAHVAVLTVSSPRADSKTIQVRFQLRPRPVLIIDSAARSVAAMLGDSIPSVAFALRSSGDTIGKLALASPDCGSKAWVSAKLSGETTPAAVTLTFDARGLVAGAFECRIQVRTSQPLVDSATKTIVVSLKLKQAPRIGLDVSSTVSAAAMTGSDASPIRVHVTNVGSGTLDGLSVGQIDYGSGATAWLTAALDTTVAPAVLTLTPSARSLAAGTVTATVPVRSTADGVVNSPSSVTITFVVSPKPFRFVISPAVVNVSYNLATGKGNSVAVSLLDANGSGQVATVVNMTTKATFGSGFCVTYVMSGPIGNPPKVPQTITVSPAPFAYGNPARTGSCSYTNTLTLDNGQVAAFTINTSVTP